MRISMPSCHLPESPSPEYFRRPKTKARFFSREVRIRVPFFGFVYFSRGTLPTKKGKGHYLGEIEGSQKPSGISTGKSRFGSVFCWLIKREALPQKQTACAAGQLVQLVRFERKVRPNKVGKQGWGKSRETNNATRLPP